VSRSAGGAHPPGALLALPLAALLALLLAWPAALLVRESLRAPGGGFSLAEYARIAREPALRRALLGSLGLSAAVALLSTALCLAPAWLLAHGRLRAAPLLRAVYALPLAFSGVIVGFLVVVMLGRAGFVPRWAQRLSGEPWLASSAYQLGGIALGYLYFEIPRAALTLEAALRRFDPALLAAARSLGARPWQAWAYVVLPLLAPALLSSLAITFSASLGSFGVVLILATREWSVLPLEIFMAYLAFPPEPRAAAALSVLLLALAFAANYGARAWLEHRGGAADPAAARGAAA
jgi:putative spermidine/putrescine transport system permease protein